MNEETKINALVNIGQSKIAEKAYEDILSEPSKKAGNALGTIINVGNTILWPIKWVNEKTRIYFENNLKKYEEKLNQIPEEKITNVPSEISMPILERFSYTSNEELSDAFVNLLAKASSSDTINSAHPGFIQLIDRLSPDEAILLKYLRHKPEIPVLTIKHYNNPENTNQYKFVIKNKTGLSSKITEIKFPKNINTYLNNLESLGVIKYQDYYPSGFDKEFENIKKQYNETLNEHFGGYENESELNKKKSEDKGMFELTDFGELFVLACLE